MAVSYIVFYHGFNTVRIIYDFYDRAVISPGFLSPNVLACCSE